MGARLGRQRKPHEQVEEEEPEHLHVTEWDNEDWIHHKSAINCLHNYALEACISKAVDRVQKAPVRNHVFSDSR